MSYFLAALIVFQSAISYADLGKQAPPPEAVRTGVMAFRKAVYTGNKQAIVSLLQFPLQSSRPFEVLDKQEFLSKYDFFVDATFKKKVQQEEQESKHPSYSYSGAWELLTYPKGWGYLAGQIWFNDKGVIVAFHPQTKKFHHYREKLFKADLKILHASLGKQDWGVDCQTKSQRIVMFNTQDGWVYASWNKGKKLSEKPDLLLRHPARSEFEGSGGNGTVEFEEGAYTYSYEFNHVCGDDPATGNRNFDGGGCDDSVQIYRGKGNDRKLVEDLVCA